MRTGEQVYTLDRVVRLVLMAGLLFGLIWVLGYLSDVLIPFAVALLLAYLLNPLVGLIQRVVPSRVASVLLTLLLTAVVLILLAWLVGPVIAEEMRHLGQVVTGLVSGSDLAKAAAERLPPDLWEALKALASRPEVEEFFRSDNLWTAAEALARKVLPGLWGLITGTVSFLMGLIGLAVIGLYLIFLMIDFQKVSRDWPGLLPPAWREPVVSFAHETDLVMNRYFRGQAMVASLVGIGFAIGFAIIGLPLGVLLGLFIGLLNMVPYLQILGLIPAFGLAGLQALETGASFWTAMGMVGLVFAVVQVIQDTFLVPRIMGKVTGLSPAMILLSLSVWGKLLGLLGLIIALPITCLLLAYYRRFVAPSPAGEGEVEAKPETV